MEFLVKSLCLGVFFGPDAQGTVWKNKRSRDGCFLLILVGRANAQRFSEEPRGHPKRDHSSDQ